MVEEGFRVEGIVNERYVFRAFTNGFPGDSNGRRGGRQRTGMNTRKEGPGTVLYLCESAAT